MLWCTVDVEGAWHRSVCFARPRRPVQPGDTGAHHITQDAVEEHFATVFASEAGKVASIVGSEDHQGIQRLMPCEADGVSSFQFRVWPVIWGVCIEKRGCREVLTSPGNLMDEHPSSLRRDLVGHHTAFVARIVNAFVA